MDNVQKTPSNTPQPLDISQMEDAILACWEDPAVEQALEVFSVTVVIHISFRGHHSREGCGVQKARNYTTSH